MFEALTLAHLLLETPLRQLCEAAPLAPLLGDLACHYAVDEEKQRLELLADRHQSLPLSSVMGRPYGEDGHHLVPRGHLLLDNVAGVRKGGMKLGERLQVASEVWLLARKQIVVDEVGGQHLLQGV